MNEPTEVQARFGADGAMTVVTLTWRGHTLRVTSMGRQWVAGERRHFLVMVAMDRIFELTYHLASGQWHIVGAPQQSLSA